MISIKDASGAEITEATHIANVNPFRYRSYYFDSETGLYYVNSRYYDSQTHRMLSADEDGLSVSTPEGLVDKNYFAYCDNNPVMRADGEGDFWHIVAGAAIGAVIGTATSVISQAASGEKIDLKKVGISALTGAIGGGCAATGIPLVGQIAIGAVLGGGGNIAEQLCDGKNFQTLDLKDALVSTAVGAAAGAAGGKGADKFYQNPMKAGTQLTKRIWRAPRNGGVKEMKKAFNHYNKVTKLTRQETVESVGKASLVASGHTIGSSIKKGWNNVKNFGEKIWNNVRGWF